MTTNDVTPVIFRVFKGTRDVIAIFPYEPGTNDPGTCMSYMHMGQHGSCDPQGVIARTTLASWAIYDSLRKELESEGPGQYRLSIIKRMPADAYRRRADAIRASRTPR